MSKNKDLIAIDSTLQEFDKISAGFAILEKQYKNIVFECDTVQGMKDAKAARDNVRKPRRRVEVLRKEAKAPLLALGRKLDDEAKRLTALLLEIEAPLSEQIEWQEQAEERDRLRKLAEEEQRRARIHDRIAELRGNTNLTPTSGSALISAHIADLEKIPVDKSFQEFEAAAQDAKVAGLSRLNALLAAAQAHEAEQERIRVERAELARLRAEAAEREEATRRERAKRDAEIAAELAEARRIAQEQRNAELAAQAEANRLERERIAAEEAEALRLWNIKRAEAQAEMDREAEENRRIAAQRAEELERQETIAREQREAEEARLANERAKLEAEQARQMASKSQMKRFKATGPSRDTVIAVVASGFGITEREAIAVLALYDWRADAA